MLPHLLDERRRTLLPLNCTNALSLDLSANLNMHSTVSLVRIKAFFCRQNQQITPLKIDRIEEFELEAISSHFIDPDRTITSHKRKASLKCRAVWKGSFKDSWYPLKNFENAHSIHRQLRTLLGNTSQRMLTVMLSRLNCWFTMRS